MSYFAMLWISTTCFDTSASITSVVYLYFNPVKKDHFLKTSVNPGNTTQSLTNTVFVRN